MIDDLSKTLRAILTRTGLSPPLDSAHVVFDHPSEKFAPQQTTVDLFLYDIRENVQLRSNEPTLECANGKVTIHHPPLRLACSYLVTAWPVGGAELAMQEQRLLSQVVEELSKHSTIPADFLQGRLKGQTPPLPLVTAVVDPQKNLSEFWTALGNRLRPSVTITATIAMDLLEPEVEGIVLTAYVGLGQRTSLDEAKANVWLFEASDLMDVAGFSGKLSKRGTPLAQYLWERLGEPARKALKDPATTVKKKQAALATELNRILAGDSLFETARFQGVQLSDETAGLRKQGPRGEGLIRFNRLLLADAFPQHLARATPTATGIFGQVMDANKKPVARAVVTIAELNLETKTDEEGRYRFVMPGPGTYTLRATKEAKTVTKQVSVEPGLQKDLQLA
jgi:Pvc16 N-terminal domain/Carboxypeptidase regulatory-like domain